MVTDHACTAFCRFVLFSLLTHQAQATAVVHMALEQIFQRNRTWGHGTTAPSSPALQGQGMKKTLMPLQPSASHTSILIQQCHAQAYELWLWLRQPQLQLLSQSWFASGRTQANPPTHLHRKVKMAKSSTEQHNLMNPCSLAMALMVSHLQHLKHGGWLTSVSWNWLKAQTAPRCQQERPLSGRLSTICSMVTVPFSVGGGQRIVGGALGIQEHQSYCTTQQETTVKTCSAWHLGTHQRNVCLCNMSPQKEVIPRTGRCSREGLEVTRKSLLFCSGTHKRESWVI